MKQVFTLLVLFYTGTSSYMLPKTQPAQLLTFNHVPDEMTGCGDSFYFTEKDKKKGIFIAVDNFEQVLVSLNGRMVKFKPGKGVRNKKHIGLFYQSYELIIDKLDQKLRDDEYYTFNAIITIKNGGKIVFQKRVIGDGGC